MTSEPDAEEGSHSASEEQFRFTAPTSDYRMTSNALKISRILRDASGPVMQNVVRLRLDDWIFLCTSKPIGEQKVGAAFSLFGKMSQQLVLFVAVVERCVEQNKLRAEYSTSGQ